MSTIEVYSTAGNKSSGSVNEDQYVSERQQLLHLLGAWLFTQHNQQTTLCQALHTKHVFTLCQALHTKHVFTPCQALHTTHVFTPCQALLTTRLHSVPGSSHNTTNKPLCARLFTQNTSSLCARFFTQNTSSLHARLFTQHNQQTTLCQALHTTQLNISVPVQTSPDSTVAASFELAATTYQPARHTTICHATLGWYH